MTAGNNGAGTPENDDPFAYLYRSEGGEDGAANDGPAAPYGRSAQAQPGVPRTSYNQVSRVGERQYGQQARGQQPGPYAQQQAPGYGRPANPAYAAPETFPGGAPRRAAPPGGGHGGRGGNGRGPNSRGLLIGAIAVVAVVVVGIAVAMINNADDDGKKDEAGSSAGPSTGGDSGEPDGEQSPTKGPAAELPEKDAASLRLDSPATVASEIEGAEAQGGAYVGGMNAAGAGATWKVDMDKAGSYRLYVGYGVPGKDANLTLTVNGKPDSRPLKMANFADAKEGEWDKGWTQTWQIVNLTKGTNTIRMSCEAGNKCDVNLDQVWLTQKNGER